MKTKYTVMWTGLIEIESSTLKAAINKVRRDKKLVARNTNWGASDGVVSYTPVKRMIRPKGY